MPSGAALGREVGVIGVGVIEGVSVNVAAGGGNIGVGVRVMVGVRLGVGECDGWKLPPKYTLMYLSCVSSNVW